MKKDQIKKAKKKVAKGRGRKNPAAEMKAALESFGFNVVSLADVRKEMRQAKRGGSQKVHKDSRVDNRDTGCEWATAESEVVRACLQGLTHHLTEHSGVPTGVARLSMQGHYDGELRTVTVFVTCNPEHALELQAVADRAASKTAVIQ